MDVVKIDCSFPREWANEILKKGVKNTSTYTCTCFNNNPTQTYNKTISTSDLCIAIYKNKLSTLKRLNPRYEPLVHLVNKMIYILEKDKNSDINNELLMTNKFLMEHNFYAITPRNIDDMKALAQGINMSDILEALKTIEKSFSKPPQINLS